MTMVAEGVKTAATVEELAARHGVEMPVCHTIYRVVHGDISAADAYLGLRTPPAQRVRPVLTRPAVAARQATGIAQSACAPWPRRRAPPGACGAGACPSGCRAAPAGCRSRPACATSAAAPAPTPAARPRWPSAPSCSTTAAATTSPHSSSGMPVTPASATAGWSSRTSSISPGDMFSPPRTMTSSMRPSTKRKPPSSRWPPSRVGNQPSSVSSAAAEVLAGDLLAPHVDLARLARPPPRRPSGRGSPAPAWAAAGRPSRAGPAPSGRRWPKASRWSSGPSTATVELVSVRP